MDVRLDHHRRFWELPPRHELPDRSDRPLIQAGSAVPQWLEERLFDQRIVLLQGPVTAEAATRTAATLLTLDALGAGPVRLQLASPDGDLTAVFSLIDTLDLMRAPVHVVAIGEVGGAAVGIFAAGRRRMAHLSARFRLTEPKAAGVAGTADEIVSAASRFLQALEDLVLRVAAVTGQPRSRVEDDFAAGKLLSAAEAREYGLVEEIVAGS